MLESILKEYTEYFYIVNEGEYSIVFLYLPYKRFKPLSKEFLTVDAYYLASNKIYHTTKKIIDRLAEYDCVEVEGNIKKIFLDYGIGSKLKNSLISLPKYGSTVALKIIKVKMKAENILPQSQTDCLNCDLCVKACPSNAIEEKYNREKCLRNGQDTLDTQKNNFELLDNSILGCDKCQRICPLNNAEYEDMPKDLMEILRIENFRKLALGGRKNLKVLEDYIGKNMVRINKMLFIEDIIVRTKKF